MKNNKFKIIVVAVLLILGGYACNTEELKKLDDPKYMLTPTNSDMSMMFTNLLITHGKGTLDATYTVESLWMKYYGTFDINWILGSLYQYVQSTNDRGWGAYRNTFAYAVQLEDYLVKLNKPEQVNNLAMTRIMKVAVIQRLTDAYGDIPISEAGLAYISNKTKPKYDKQADIYKYMLETLDAEAANLSTAAELIPYNWKGGADAKSARDIVYSGDITKWKKFAYSLMLRLAMRASDADPALAKLYAEKAIAGGVITSNTDNWVLKTKNGLASEQNSLTYALAGYGDMFLSVKLGEYFVDYLKAKSDPRRKVIFGGRLINTGTACTPDQMRSYYWDPTKWNYDVSTAKGMLHGTTTMPGANMLAYQMTYTHPNPMMFQYDLPIEVLTAAEMLYLTAEASLKGWTTGTTADAAYTAAITASCTQFTAYTGLMASQKITAAEITAYIAATPLGTGAAARQRLAEELWVTLYLNPMEAWSYVRRMNLIMPENVTNAHMPVRYVYAENERSNNLENLNNALVQIGLSAAASKELEYATRVWWDTQSNY